MGKSANSRSIGLLARTTIFLLIGIMPSLEALSWPEMNELEANIVSLEARLPAPCLGRVPETSRDAVLEAVAGCLDLDRLLAPSCPS